MKSQAYVLTNEDNKVMAIIQAENETVLKEKALKAISEDYDLENVHLLKSEKVDFDYVLTCQLDYSDDECYEEDFCLTTCEVY
jgi:hypothetical protein